MLCCGVLLDRALIAGAFLGYGWINEIFQCDFHANGIAGLLCDNNPNAVNIVDNNFDENGAAIIVNTGVRARGHILRHCHSIRASERTGPVSSATCTFISGLLETNSCRSDVANRLLIDTHVRCGRNQSAI